MIYVQKKGRVVVTIRKKEGQTELSVSTLPRYTLVDTLNSRAEAEAADNNSLDAILGARDSFRKLNRAFPRLSCQSYESPYHSHRFDISKALDACKENAE